MMRIQAGPDTPDPKTKHTGSPRIAATRKGGTPNARCLTIHDTGTKKVRGGDVTAGG